MFKSHSNALLSLTILDTTWICRAVCSHAAHGTHKFRLLLNSVTLHHRYFVPHVLPPRALLAVARWRLAVISLAPRATCSEWERRPREKLRSFVKFSCTVIQFFSVEAWARTTDKIIHVMFGKDYCFFLLLELCLLSMTDKCVEKYR